MKLNRTNRQLLIMVLIFLAGWGIFTFVSYLNRDAFDDGKILSSSKEEKTAQAIHALILSDFDTIHPAVTVQAIQQIFDRLEESIDSGYNYQFYIIDSEMNNAFATLNGNIYIMKGLLNFVDSPEVLAAVIAHEMGHIQHHDFETRLSKNVGFAALEMIVTGGNSNLASELSKTLFSAKYDRNQEQAADDFAKELLIKSGIHPENLGILFLSLEREDDFDLPEGTTIFMSHPHLKTRIEEAVNYEFPEAFEEKPLNIDWEKVTEEMESY